MMALDVKISFSWTDYCRLCLLDNGILLPLFEEEGCHRKLAEKIETCLKIVTYDGDPLPRRICHKCLFKLNQMYEFQNMALQSLERLKVHLLPLKHIPSVQEYLDRANVVEKEKQDEVLLCNSSQGEISPVPNNVSHEAEPRPTLRVKKEYELRAPKLMSCVVQSPSPSPPDSTSAMPKPASWEKNPFSQECNVDSLQTKFSTESHDSAKETARQESEVILTQSQKRSHSNETEADHDEATTNKPGPIHSKVKRKKRYVGLNSLRPVPQSTQWKCILCNSNFLTKTALTLHMDICLRCSTCSTEFTSIAEKAQHEADSHISVLVDAEKKHMRKRCSYCPARFISNVMLTMHVRHDHKPTGSYLCEAGKSNSFQNQDVSLLHSQDSSNCGKEAPSVVNLNPRTISSMTEEAHSSHENKERDCTSEICSKLGSAADVKSNYDKASKKVKKGLYSGPLRCSKCSRVFDKKLAYESHVKNHDLLNHRCIHCGGAYASEGKLQQHVLHQHKSYFEEYLCKVCSKHFQSKSALHTHKKMHRSIAKIENGSHVSKGGPKPRSATDLICTKCNEAFLNDDALMLHLYQHATEPLDCKNNLNDFGKQATNGSKLKLPETAGSHVLKSPIKISLECEHCSLVCHSKEFYQAHISKHSNKSKSLFPCTGCGQIFRNIDALAEHTCPGEHNPKQTCCLDCGQALIEGEVHECDNRCPQCDKVFRSAKGQRIHAFYKHGKGTPLDVDGIDKDQEPPFSLNAQISSAKEVKLPTPCVKSKIECSDDIVAEATSAHLEVPNLDIAASDVAMNHVDELPPRSSILQNLLKPPSFCSGSIIELNVPCPPALDPDNDSLSAPKLDRPWHTPLDNHETSLQDENDNTSSLGTPLS